MPTKTTPTKTRKYRRKSGIIGKIRQHPTIRMIGLFSDLPISDTKEVNKFSFKNKTLLGTLFLALVLLLSIYLLAYFNKDTVSSVIVVNKPVDKIQQESESIVTEQPLDIKSSSSNELTRNEKKEPIKSISPKINEQPLDIDSSPSNKTTSKIETESIQPTTLEANNVVQLNTKKIDKLEALLLEEQRKNKELYQKINSQDEQLKELLENAIKNIVVDDINKAYVTSIT